MKNLTEAFMPLLFGVVAVSTLGACSSSPPPLQTVIYEAGPSWKAGLPPEQQDLQGHFAYMGDLFKRGELVANGPTLDDFRGFYVFKGDQRSRIESIATQDPGVRNGVLKVVSIGAWNVGIENLGASIGSGKLYVLEYLPGSNWDAGKPLDGQKDFSKTIDYVTNRFKQGGVLAAGPVSDRQARVILVAGDDAEAQRFVANDPSTASGLFQIKIKPWMPFQRQAATQK